MDRPRARVFCKKSWRIITWLSVFPPPVRRHKAVAQRSGGAAWQHVSYSWRSLPMQSGRSSVAASLVVAPLLAHRSGPARAFPANAIRAVDCRTELASASSANAGRAGDCPCVARGRASTPAAERARHGALMFPGRSRSRQGRVALRGNALQLRDWWTVFVHSQVDPLNERQKVLLLRCATKQDKTMPLRNGEAKHEAVAQRKRN